jgi:hypothetical protein
LGQENKFYSPIPLVIGQLVVGDYHVNINM